MVFSGALYGVDLCAGCAPGFVKVAESYLRKKRMIRNN